MFDKTFKQLKKKYPNILNDINPYLENFQKNIFSGVRDSDFSFPVYKLKINNRDAQRGKSGGYRLIYLKKEENYFILLMIIYSKSDQEDLSNIQIKRLETDLEFLYKAKGWKK